MKLTELEIHGFKSFPDRTRLKFDAGITGIVGPNGCGKSNIIDAIRWVLGEQRTRNLRSDKMENVIFNGTEKRKKASVAEVSMLFENTRNLLPTEYSTVKITRRLYRDGDSEYLLNGVSCRLKDITSLFLDTGIGPDSYAIIELRMVEELLADKNNARRQLFEEAAGISKYKLRKKETFARLEDTEKSLARVEDLLYEVDKNMRSLERQAKRAAQFNNLKDAYRSKSTQMALLKMSDLNNQLQVLEGKKGSLDAELSEAQRQLAGHDAQVQELQAEVLKREEKLKEQQQAYDAHQEAIRKREGEHALRNERMKYLHERRNQLQAQIAGEGEAISAIEGKLEGLEQAIDQANEAYDKQEFLLQELDGELEEAQEAYKNRRLQTQQLAEQLQSKRNALQQQERERDRRQVQLQSLQDELNRSQNDRQSGNDEQGMYAEKLEKLRKAVAELEAQTQQLQKAQTEHDTALADANTQHEQLREAHYDLRRRLDAKQQEYKLTKGLVESLEGFSESIKYLKKHASWMNGGTPQLLSDVFYTPEPVRVVLESFLEPYLSYFVVQNRAQAQAGVKLLREAGKGRASFLILDEVAAHMAQHPQQESRPEVTGVELSHLLAQVEYDEKYKPLAEYLLGSVWVAEGSLPASYTVPQGITLVERSGTQLAQPLKLSGGAIGLFEGKRVGRGKLLEKLGPEIKALERKQAELEQQLQQATNTLEHHKQQNPDKALQEAQRELSLLQRQLSALEAKQDEQQNFVLRLENRASDLSSQINRLEEELKQLAPRQERLQMDVDELEATYSQEQQQLERLSENLNTLTKRHNDENIGLMRLKSEVDGHKQAFRFQREQIDATKEATQKARQELETIQHDIQRLVEQGELHDDDIVALYKQRDDLQAALHAQEGRVASIKNQVIQLEHAARGARSQREQLQLQLVALKDQQTEFRIQQNALRERLQVEFMIDIAGLKAEDVLGPEPDAHDLSELESEVKGLREKLHSFGEVNPTAIEAFNEIKERHGFMLEQRDDLLEAKDNLMSTIEEMDAAARERFMQAFEQIRTNFQQVFRTLFTEQDKADLILTDPDNPLETGIDIIAQPKGKRPLTINQLSGGEKTLTATSLLFAIYLLKPAPFCIFDEVDAPLDDANIDKFTNIITEFSGSSQFIIVTHNKRTMAKSSVLYGVTMEESGVSRTLPVDLLALDLQEAVA